MVLDVKVIKKVILPIDIVIDRNTSSVLGTAILGKLILNTK